MFCLFFLLREVSSHRKSSWLYYSPGMESNYVFSRVRFTFVILMLFFNIALRDIILFAIIYRNVHVIRERRRIDVRPSSYREPRESLPRAENRDESRRENRAERRRVTSKMAVTPVIGQVTQRNSDSYLGECKYAPSLLVSCVTIAVRSLSP